MYSTSTNRFRDCWGLGYVSYSRNIKRLVNVLSICACVECSSYVSLSIPFCWMREPLVYQAKMKYEIILPVVNQNVMQLESIEAKHILLIRATQLLIIIANRITMDVLLNVEKLCNTLTAKAVDSFSLKPHHKSILRQISMSHASSSITNAVCWYARSLNKRQNK